MTFAFPKALWLLAGLPVLAVFFYWSWRRKQSLMRLFSDSRLLADLASAISARKQWLRNLLLLAAVAGILISLAQPQWGHTFERTQQRSLDVVIAIDTSKSMSAIDLKPNRIEHARLAALELRQLCKGDRFALLPFAGSAFLQCPLTTDLEVFRQNISEVAIGLIPQGGTSLATAIRESFTAFVEVEDNHRVLILFTDGEDNEPGISEALAEANRRGVRIFTVGVGTTTGELLQLPGVDGQLQFQKDAAGNIIRSQLNEGLLQDIASKTKGFYSRLEGANSMEMLYKNGLAPLPKSGNTEAMIRRQQDRFQWPLAVAILLLAAEVLVPTRRGLIRNGNGLPQALWILLAILFPIAATASPDTARSDFLKGDFDRAQREYVRLMQMGNPSPQMHYNAGTAALQRGDWSEATGHLTNALTASDLTLQQRAYYNLGNAAYRSGENAKGIETRAAEWEGALKNYQAAMKLDPKDEDAQFNHELVKRRLEELRKKQQPKSEKPKESKQPKSGEADPPPKAKGNNDDSPKKKGNGKEKNETPDSGQDNEDTPDKGGEDGKMSPTQARRLLESQRGEEKSLIFRPQDRRHQRVLKDW